MVGIAQLVRALDCDSRGWGFKSPYSPLAKARKTFVLRAFLVSPNFNQILARFLTDFIGRFPTTVLIGLLERVITQNLHQIVNI